MTYEKEYYQPESKGEYWRKIYNIYRDETPYSLGVVTSILNKLPKDTAKETEFFSSIDPADREAYERGKNDLFPMHVAIMLYTSYERQFRKAYRYVMSHPKEFKNKTFEFHQISNQSRKLAFASMGYRDSAIKDARSLNEKVRDYWFHGGFAHYISDIEKSCFGFFGLLLDPKELPTLPINQFEHIYTGSPTWSTAEWALTTFPELNTKGWNQGTLSRFIDSLRLCTQKLIPLGELEVFRQLVLKTWSADQPKSLAPLELLTLNKYVSLSRFEIDLDKCNLSRVFPLKLLEKRKLLDEKGNLGHIGYLTDAGGLHLGSSIGRLVARVYLDFWDELNYRILFPSNKGSLQCIQCGVMITRSFYGHNQKYCSRQCLQREAKKKAQRRKKLKGRLIS